MEQQSPPGRERPPVYPYPRSFDLRALPFGLTEQTTILLPADASPNDRFLARFLSAELVDRYQLAVRCCQADSVPADGFVIVGDTENPLVREACRRRNIEVDDVPGPEGYVLDVGPDGVVAAGRDFRGALYGMQSVLQLVQTRDGQTVVRGARVRDWPDKAFRGLRLYLPGKENLAFFRRFVRNFATLLKYNTLVLEVNAAMRLDRHPELNAGWYELGRCLNYTRRDRPEGPGRQFQDSTHHDTADFGLLEKDDVAGIVGFAREHGMDVIPEIPSLTHAYYLLARHRELAEIRTAEWPDTYCPLQEGAYELLFDVVDEYLEVMKPETVHIGHDEWRMPMGVCPTCRGRDYRELFAADVARIHAHLAERGVRTAMWGDHLLESVRGAEYRPAASPSGRQFRRPAGLTPEQVAQGIPKDILVLNWFWNAEAREGADANERQLAEWGFEQVFGNLTPDIAQQSYDERSSLPGLLGGAPSSWAATTEANIGKDLTETFVGCADLLWSGTSAGRGERRRVVQALMPMVRRGLAAEGLPSEHGEAVRPLDIACCLNIAPCETICGGTLPRLRSGEVGAGTRVFQLAGASGGKRAAAVAYGRDATGSPSATCTVARPRADVSSLLFLHAAARPAGNRKAYFTTYNFADSAELLGWYEVQYEDGFVVTVPVRYGVNVLEWSWTGDGEGVSLCYQADPVLCSREGDKPAVFWAYEWRNPRFGQPVREVRLAGAGPSPRDAAPAAKADNALVLLGISVVPARTPPVPADLAPEGAPG